MKKTVMVIKAFMMACMFMCATASLAANGVWNGTVDSLWTTSANWSASPYPSGTDTASFTNNGNNQTAIDITGLLGIKYITFDSPAVAAYTNGTGAANSQTLIMVDGGEFKLTDTAANSQLFNCAVQLGANVTGQNYSFKNDNLSKTLTFNNVFGSVAGGGGAGDKNLTISGVGNTTILGNMTKGGAGRLIVTDTSSGTLTLSGSNTISVLIMNGGSNSVVDIGSGYLYLNNLGDRVIESSQGGIINGTGTIRFSTAGGANYADVRPATGKTLVINPSIICDSDGGFELNAGGTAVLNGINTFLGDVYFTSAGGTISVSKIGNRGSTTSNLGKGNRIFMSQDNCKLVYTGIGETSDRLFELSQNNFTIDQSGLSGKLTFSTSPTVNAGTRNLRLQGSTAAIGEFSVALGNNYGTLAITKEGTGTWILSGVNTYSGATTVNGGKLLFNSPGTSAGSAVTVNNGAILGGNTSINGNVVLNAGGMLAPGDVGSIGTLSLGVNLALNDSSLLFDVSSGVADKVSVVGSLTVNGANTIILSLPDGTLPAGTYTLMTFASRNGTGTFVLSPAYANASLQVNATSVQLVVTDTGISNKIWKGNVSENWDGSDLNWTNGSAAVTFSTGDAVLFDDSASLFNVASANPVLPASVMFNNNINTYAVSAAIEGTAEFFKFGAGTVTLSGANTYAGQTTIAGGALTISGAGVLGNGNYATNIINNGAFNYASSATQTSSGTISGIGALTLSGSGTMTLSGSNTYSGVTLVNGPGTLVISGDNASCSGQTIVNAGVLKALSASALGTTAVGTTVNTNGTLELAGNIVTFAEPLSLFGTLSSQTGSNTYAGVVSLQTGSSVDVGSGSFLILTASTPNIGAFPFSKTGAGTLRLTADPNHVGVCTVAGGTLELMGGGTTDADFIINPSATLMETTANLGNFRLTNNGTFDLRISDDINGLDGSGLVTIGNTGSYNFSVGNGNQSGTFSGVITNGSGAMAFTKAGTGIQILSGMNTYTGVTTVTAGTLSLRGTNVLSLLSPISMAGATLQVLQDGVGNNGTNTFGKDVTLNGSVTATIDVGNNGSGNTGNTIAFGALNNGPLGTAYNSIINFTGTNGYLQSFTSLGLSSGSGQGTALRPTTTSVTILGAVTNRQASGGYDTLTLEGTSAGNSIWGRISDAAHYTGTGNGDTRIIKNNISTWTLAGTNSYRGDTTVNGGTLLINGSIASNAIVATGGTLGGAGTIKGNVTANAGGLLAPGDFNGVGTLSINGTLTLNGNTLIFDVSNVATDKVAVAGALIGTSANTVVLNFPGGPIAPGSYTLMTFASKGTGTFALASPYPNASLSTPGNTSLVLTVAGGETSWGRTWKGDLSTSWDGPEQNWRIGSVATNFVTGDLITFDDTAANFSVSSIASVAPGSLLFNNRANNYTVSAAIGGTVPLVMSGTATVALTGTNTFSGSTIINSGTLMMGGAGLLGNGLYTANITNNGVFNYASSVTQTNSGILSGAGTLSVSGSGTLALSGANTYTGPTLVNAGMLKVMHGSGLGTIATGTTVARGAILDLAGTITTLAEALTLNGTLSSQTGTNIYGGAVTLVDGASIDVGAGSMLSLNVFTANGAYTKEGAGWLKLLADPNGPGLMTINNGVAELAQAGGATESDIVVNSGGTLIGNSGDAINRVNNVTVNAGGTYVLRQSDVINMFSGAGTLTRDITGLATITVGDNNGSSTFSGVIQNGLGTMALTKSGSGIQTLSGLSTYNGTTTLSAGQLNINNGGSGAANSAIGIGPFVITGGTIDNTSGADITLSPAIVQSWNGNFTFAGSKSLNLGTGAVTMNAARTVTVLTNTLTVGGAIGGNFSLTKAGAGTLTLAGVNTYNGATTVSAGKLLVNSPGSLAAGAVTNSSNSSGVVLGGNGSISGAVTLHPGGMLSPGAEGSAGTLSLGSTLTLNGIPLLFDVSNVATDKVSVASALTLNGTNAVVLSFPGGEIQAGTYTLMTFASRTGNGTFVLSPAYANCSLVTNATSVALQVSGSPAGFSGVTWKGNLSGNWNTTAQNWTNSSGTVVYTDGIGVTFDDTAVGNFNITSDMDGIAPGAILFNNTVNNYSITAPITNTAPLMKLGPGSTMLSGISAYNPLSILVGGGALTLGGLSQLNNGLYAGNVVNNGILTFASAASQTYSGAISGAGTMLLSGSGIVTLSGTNTYTGPTTVNLGATLALAGNIATPAGATLNLWGTLSSQTGSNTYAGAVSFQVGSIIDVGPGSTLILSASTANIGAYPFTKIGGGLLKLTLEPNHTGPMTINGGSVELAGATTDGDYVINAGAKLIASVGNAINDNNYVTINSGGLYDLRQSDTIKALLGVGTLTMGITGTPTITVGGNNGSGVFSGVIENGAGTMSFAKNGTGIQILLGTNTYTGTTTVNAGTLLVNSPGSLSNGTVTVANTAILGGNGTVNGPVTLSAGGILAPGGVSVIGTLTLGSSLTLNGNSLFFDLSSTAQDKVAVGGALTATGANTILVNGTVPTGDYILMTFASQTVAIPFSLAGISDASLELTDTNLVLHVTSGSSGSGLTWKGDKSAIWDGGIQNWLNNSAPAAFANGDAVLFDDTAVGNFTVNSGSAVTPSSVQFNNSLNTYTVSASMGGSASLSKFGTGTVNLSGANTYSGPMTIGQGTLAITGAGQLGSGNYAQNILNNGTFTYASSAMQTLSGDISGSGPLTMSGTGTLTLAGTNTFTGNLAVNTGNLLLTGSNALATATVNVGATATNAVMKMTPGSSLIGTTGNFTVGSILNGYGALYLDGGRVVRTTPATIDSAFCFGTVAGGYGYFNMSDGYLSSTRFQLGVGAASMGIARITNGIASFSEYILVSRNSGSTGVLTVEGGSLYHTNASQNVALGYEGGRAELNMLGGLLDSTGKPLTVRQANNNPTGIVNLCSGTLIVDNFQNTSPGIALLNFNGGVLKSSEFSTAFLPTTLTGVYVNGPFGANTGGARIDSAGRDITFAAPLIAPPGSGVTAITLATQGSGYIGEPYVSITGDGLGATAVANMADDGTGKGTYKVASVTVTTPGINYTTAPTVTFLKGGATAVAPTIASVTRAPATAGGLTKLGTGTLTLSGINTYAGETTISNGAVRLGIANALPTNSVVNVRGGVYDLNGFTVTNGAINTTAGVIGSGNLNCASINKDGDGLLTFTATQIAPAAVIINGGTFSLGGAAAGLFEGRVNGAFELTLPNPKTAVRLSPVNAYSPVLNSNQTGGIWVDNSTYIYTGYIWNRSTNNETWTFCKNFDDSVLIKVDNTVVLSQYNDWNVVTTTNYVMTPGPHAFEVRLGQGGGGVGQPAKRTPGAGFDPLGRSNAQLCVPIIDPGDGSLLTLFADPYAVGSLPKRVGKLADASTVQLAANTMLDLGTTNQTLAGLSGSGTVSNGALTVTGEVSPAATNTIGTLTVKGNTTLSGKLLANVATDGTSDLLDVQGNLTLLSPTLEIQNLQGLSTLKIYTLVTCSDTLTGTFTPTNLPDRWTLRYTTDGKVQLYYKGGTMIRIM
jgi:autotransporter-associated beta strand protein